ncbi:MAG: DNA-processing protein DprA, partial [Candidatus Omnitrophica bacterium]|nr:DNA-processing protein DprA [Candidatus Omnitrophota bacterium]
MMNETAALVALNGVDALSNRQILRLLDHFGSAKAIWGLTCDQLKDAKVLTERAITAIQDFPCEKFLENEYNLISNKIILITIFDDLYPEVLKQISDAPVVLYVYGAGLQDLQPAVAIVGSRKASIYGRMTAGKLAGNLAQHGVTVVSGLARGVDTAAHEGCLAQDGRTVAVLGCGLGVSYPRENEKLRHQIAERGAVVSEFPMQTGPMPYHFPRRNRIVSGLSQGVVVVEAAAKSGALITADFALEQGREVYAVPAMIDHPNAAGGHSLIRQGAQLITSAEDILADLTGTVRSKKPEPMPIARKSQSIPAQPDEIQMLAYMADRPVHIDELVTLSGMEFPEATRLLLDMEMK